MDDLTHYPGHHATRSPHASALVSADGGSRLTYGALDAGANQTARMLRRCGLEVGDHVSFWVDNEIEYPMWWWGARYAGLYYTLISTGLTPEEVGYIVGDSGSRVLIVSPAMAAGRVDELHAAVGDDVEIIPTTDGADGLDARLAAESTEPPPGMTAGQPMLYSSGTTGRPKAVKRDLTGVHPGAPSPEAMLAQYIWGLGAGSVYLSPAPLYHAAPYGFVTGTTAIGGTAVIMRRFDAEMTLRAIQDHRVTVAQFVPTMLARLVALPESVRSAYDLSSLEVVIHAAAPCPAQLKEQVIDWFGPIVHEYYSGTEGAGFTRCDSHEWLAHRGTVGRPLIGEIHILDDDGHELPIGHIGHVFFADGIPFEYHNDREQTRRAHTRDGWATMGDIGRVDEGGYLYLTDRASFVINRGGVNIYPQEAETVLLSQAAVADAAVFGVPDEIYGERVKAVVVPADGHRPGPDLGARLIAACRERLAKVKCPESIDFRDALPRTDTGKLLKGMLREEYRHPAAQPA